MSKYTYLLSFCSTKSSFKTIFLGDALLLLEGLPPILLGDGCCF